MHVHIHANLQVILRVRNGSNLPKLTFRGLLIAETCETNEKEPAVALL